jgi:hypothetical protein
VTTAERAHKAAELWVAYIRGWQTGTRSGVMVEFLANNRKLLLREAYRKGYEKGREDASRTHAEACKIYNHKPDVLRDA